MRGRRGPGLIGTAVVVGGAAHMGAKSAQKSQAAAQQEAAQNAQIAELQAQQTAPSRQPRSTGRARRRRGDPEVRGVEEQGMLSEEEFAAKKKQILGI